MSTLKRYNDKTQQWEPINQAPATGVYTDNPLLTENSDEIISVEDVLLKNKQDINLLRKNVSWLALHGGGGGAGGGGIIGDNNATIQLFDPADNATDTNEIIWSNSYNNITYKINSNTSTSTYTVYIRVNGIVKYTAYNVKRNTNQIVPSNTLGLGNMNTVITITAVDRDENEFTKNCKVIIASVKINPIAETKITQLVLRNGDPSFIISFQSSVAGDYKLYWSNSNIYYDENKGWCDATGPMEDSATQRSQYLDILNLGTTITTKTIKVNNIYDSADVDNKVSLFDDPNSISPGSYVRYFKLVNANNNDLYSETVTAPIVITPADGLLVIPSVGNKEDNRYVVSSDSIMYVKFVTYNGVSSTGTYSFTIRVKNEAGEYFQIPLDSNQSINKTFKTPITVPINISAFGDVFKKPGNYEVQITAKYGTLTNTGICYVMVTEPSTNVVKKYLDNINKYAVLDLTFWDNTWNTEVSDTSSHIQYDNKDFWYYDNSLKNTHKAYVDLYNIGADSGLLAGNSVYYKFTHTAAAEVSFDKSIRSKVFPKNSEDYDSLISGYDYQFSLQVAYSLENITDDSSTVFKMGNYDINTGLGYGVIITAHNYYVKIDDTIINGIFQDNDFTQFDLVCFRDSNNLKWIYIYQNGVLLKAAEHVTSSSGYSLSDIDKMYLACSGITKDNNNVITHDHINVNYYSTRLYNIPLNDCDIVCSYVNNYSNYKRKISDGSLDPVVISNLLKRNLLNSDKSVEEENLPICQVFDYNESREQSGYNWGVSYDGTNWILGGVGDIPNTSNIPVITLTTSWTYDEFIKVGANMEPATGTFTYITPGDAENMISACTVT